MRQSLGTFGRQAFERVGGAAVEFAALVAQQEIVCGRAVEIMREADGARLGHLDETALREFGEIPFERFLRHSRHPAEHSAVEVRTERRCGAHHLLGARTQTAHPRLDETCGLCGRCVAVPSAAQFAHRGFEKQRRARSLNDRALHRFGRDVGIAAESLRELGGLSVGQRVEVDEFAGKGARGLTAGRTRRNDERYPGRGCEPAHLRQKIERFGIELVNVFGDQQQRRLGRSGGKQPCEACGQLAAACRAVGGVARGRRK
jgi:hypothetical protein